MKKLECLRCGAAMGYYGREHLQKGDMGPWVGNLNFTMQGGLELDIYSCPACGKVEFFMPGFRDKARWEEEMEDCPPEATENIVGVSMDGIPQVRCPHCGREHDFDYPRCPHCDYEY